MAVDPMEEVAKRMQGLKDSRGPVGMLARGKNMYPAGNNAQSGPGGPDMGRPPTAVPPEAVQAVMQQTGHVAPPQITTPPQISPQGQNTAFSNLARSAMQAAAQRKLQRGQ
jgi:hypothetical protein